MKACFVASGPINWASARLRAFWVAEQMADAVAVTIHDNETVPNADVYIWQKRFNLEFMERTKDRRHIWDICDPMWWFAPDDSRKVMKYITSAVCCNQALADDFHQWSQMKAAVIPDRLNLAHFKYKHIHGESNPVRLIWFGMSVNRVALAAAWANLERLHANGYHIELTICDDTPHMPLGWSARFPVYYTQWALEHEVATIAAHDLAILPDYPGPWGKVKSANKIHTAWACGVPVTGGEEYSLLEALVKFAAMREHDAAVNLEWVQDNADVSQSAREWEALLWS